MKMLEGEFHLFNIGSGLLMMFIIMLLFVTAGASIFMWQIWIISAIFGLISYSVSLFVFAAAFVGRDHDLTR